MKKLILLALGAGLVPISESGAQLFSPESLTGAALGGIAGAVIGHNSGRHGGEGAAIGAGAGFLLGSLVHHDRRQRGYYDEPYYGGYSYYRRPYYSYHAGPVAPGYYVASTQVTQPALEPAQTTPVSPPQANPPPPKVSAMSSANRLFGR